MLSLTCSMCFWSAASASLCIASHCQLLPVSASLCQPNKHVICLTTSLIGDPSESDSNVASPFPLLSLHYLDFWSVKVDYSCANWEMMILIGRTSKTVVTLKPPTLQWLMRRNDGYINNLPCTFTECKTYWCCHCT